MNAVVGKITTYKGRAIAILHNESAARCLLVDGIAYVLKPSKSPYGMQMPDGKRHQFACLDGCCDAGLREGVRAIVAAAAAFGARKVVLHTGRGYFHFDMIAGLPVEDVSNHVGTLAEGLAIIRE